jgi:hypothetical protein
MVGLTSSPVSKPMNDEEKVCAILGRHFISKNELCSTVLKYHRQLMGLLIELYRLDKTNSHFEGVHPDMLAYFEAEVNKKKAA